MVNTCFFPFKEKKYWNFFSDAMNTENIGNPVMFQVNYTKNRNLANYAFGVTLTILESLSESFGSVNYNVMNLNSTRIVPLGCTPGKRRRRRRSVDLSKY